jgi:hypothetical protein
MKKSVKLFAFVLVGITFFSCTTDEYDAALEQSVKVTENIQKAQFREGYEEGKEQDSIVVLDTLSINREENQPVIVIKKD